MADSRHDLASVGSLSHELDHFGIPAQAVRCVSSRDDHCINLTNGHLVGRRVYLDRIAMFAHIAISASSSYYPHFHTRSAESQQWIPQL
jgi:hypothetical protein